MKKIVVALVMAATLVTAFGLSHPKPVAAFDCAATNLSLYVDWFETGTGQSFCFGLSGNLANLANIPGPCNGNSNWNDCASSAIVNVGATWCTALYAAANYGSRMYTFWGPLTGHVENLLSPNDALSSIKWYQKTPATPAGNC